MSSRANIVAKVVFQLGPAPLALYALYRLGLKTGYYKRVENRELQTSHRFSAPLLSTHLFSLPGREALLRIIGENGKASLIQEADEILAGQFRLFGGGPVDLKLTVSQPLQHWTAYETHPHLLSTLALSHVEGFHSSNSDHSPIPDLKFLWEPARFGWAFSLGRAFHITQENKYAEAFFRYFEIFTEHNPPYLGPHWMNGQEAAIRLMALVWAAHVFETAPASGAERRGRLLQSIARHAARIPPTLIYARSQNNNHLVTESAALYTAGLFFGNSKWRSLGWRWLNWALQHQISGYGEYIQHSTNYHRLMLQTALWVHMIRADDWPHATAQALTRAAHWLFSMLDPVSGRAPNLGSNDGALIFPLSAAPFHDFRPTLQAAARAFLNTQMTAGVWDESSTWLGLAPAAVAGVLPAGKTYDPSHYLADNPRGRNSWVHVRASRFRSRLAHMDQLHLDLWWRGLNIAQDAGTYLYNAGPPWDNSLVSTRVHNTVTVDGRDQMVRAGRFLVLDWFPAYSKASVERDEDILQRVSAYHNGYRRSGVRHERTVTVFADERWHVRDELKVEGFRFRVVPHVYRLHWLLMDGEWEIVNRGSGIELRIRSSQGAIALHINLQPSNLQPSSLQPVTSLVRAGKLIHGQRDVLPFEGWVSPTYGVKIPALSLAVEVKSSRTVCFTSEFSFPT